MNRRGERGSITAFVAVVAAALVLVAGMAYDGGQIIVAHSAARHDAERAARAGAQQIDLDYLRTTSEPRLDAVAAVSAARDYLQRAGARGAATVSGASISVTVTRTQPMRILPGAHRSITVTATATAVNENTP